MTDKLTPTLEAAVLRLVADHADDAELNLFAAVLRDNAFKREEAARREAECGDGKTRDAGNVAPMPREGLGSAAAIPTVRFDTTDALITALVHAAMDKQRLVLRDAETVDEWAEDTKAAMVKFDAASQALRARLTAGDAAIKRVAELSEAVELLRQDHAAMNARLVGALDDLAAARAENDRLRAVVNICITRIDQPNMSPDANYVLEVARAVASPRLTSTYLGSEQDALSVEAPSLEVGLQIDRAQAEKIKALCDELAQELLGPKEDRA